MIVGVDASRANVPVLTGTERYAFEVLRRLPALRPDIRWRLYVREAPHQRWGNLPSNAEFRVLNWPPRWLWSHLRLAWELLQSRPNLFFVPVGAIPFFPKLPTATTIHDVAFERYPELYRGPVVRAGGLVTGVLTVLVRLMTLGRYGLSQLDYQRWSVRRALQAAQVFCVSEFSKRECVELLGASSERITVTPLAADIQHVVMTDIQRCQQAYKLQRPYILVVGRLERKKNIDGVLAAFRLVAEEHPGTLDLVLVGAAGPGWDEMRKNIPNDWVGHSVHLVGVVSEADRAALLAGANQLLFVSRYEGFGLPPLEAMQAGIPVVAARTSAIPEVVGEAAQLISPEDHQAIAQAVWQLFQDQSLRTRSVSAGRERAAHFSWDQTAQRTVDGLSQLGLRGDLKSGRVKPA